MKTEIEIANIAEMPIEEWRPICPVCRYVYVVSTGGYRFAVESDIPIKPLEAFRAAIPRFKILGCNLGRIISITECSAEGDASNPHYIETISALKMLGELHEVDTQPTDQSPTP